jgi:hypothetical protein
MGVTIEMHKALFAQLVAACGGVEASGALLGVSHQRISQLQTLGNTEEPHIRKHTAPLEAFCGQAIVTGALARIATGASLTADPMKEIGDVVLAQAEVLHLERSGADPKTKRRAALRLVREASEVADAYAGQTDQSD